MAYTTIDDPTAYFQTKIYTGNGANNRALTFAGNSDLQPDWLWIKNRSETQSHALFDSVRGATKRLGTISASAESTENTNLDSFDSDGFTVDSELIVNGNADNMVAWAWKAGTSFSNDASSTSIGTIDSTGSVNTDAGFSIITYTASGSNATIAHGLGVAPAWIIVKGRTTDNNWRVGHNGLSSWTYRINLEATSAESSQANVWNSTAPTSSVFSIGTSSSVNDSGVVHMAYCFAEKKGYSKFGSYVGNGNADGTFIYLGFKPAWFLCKNTQDAGDNWIIHDNKRDTFNVTDNGLAPNSNEVEFTDVDMDFLSNGVKMRNDTGRANSAKSFIYMAFAENPFVTSTGVPATAR